MNWTTASALAEVVSSAAILATLVYLAIQTRQIGAQIRQNNSALISNSRQGSLDAEIQILGMMLDHPESNVFSRTFPTGKVDFDISELTAVSALLRIREHQWLQYQDGLLDAATWQSYLKLLTSNLKANATMRGILEYISPYGLNDEFLAVVQDELSE